MNVLSLFDGMSCGRIALDRAGIKYDKYFASEIDKFAIKVSTHNYPDTQHLGDVTQVRGEDLPEIELLIGGSPCQGFSFAGKGLNFDDPRSRLFFEFVRLKNELNPKYFLLENVPMKREHQMVISKYLGVEPIVINSALVSAQNRVRYYWTNIKAEPFNLFGDCRSTIRQPKDKRIFLKDILEVNTHGKYFLSGKRLEQMIKRQGKFSQLDGSKAYCLTARTDAGWSGDFLKVDINGIPKNNQEKAACFTAGANSAGNHSDMDIIQDGAKYRRLTPLEVERLQTVPDNYTAVVSDSQRYKMLGNGWTVDVIAWILSHIDAL